MTRLRFCENFHIFLFNCRRNSSAGGHSRSITRPDYLLAVYHRRYASKYKQMCVCSTEFVNRKLNILGHDWCRLFIAEMWWNFTRMFAKMLNFSFEIYHQSTFLIEPCKWFISCLIHSEFGTVSKIKQNKINVKLSGIWCVSMNYLRVRFINMWIFWVCFKTKCMKIKKWCWIK